MFLSKENVKFVKIIKMIERKRTKVYPELAVKYYYSNRFIHFLETNMNYSVYNYYSIIMNNEKERINPDFNGSYIDIGRKNDTITYIPEDKIIKLYKEECAEAGKEMLFSNWIIRQNRLETVWNKYRVEIKIGRFLRKFIPEVRDTEVEEFTNLYKSYVDGFGYEMEIVKGDDIIKYYNIENQDIQNGGSSLDGSCMAYSSSSERYNGNIVSKRLQFYSLNENCGLLILRYKGSIKIKGRALIWTTTNSKKYVDNIYVDNESDYFLYKKYIIDNGCTSMSVKGGDKPMEVESNEKIKELFSSRELDLPYLDTFAYYADTNKIRY